MAALQMDLVAVPATINLAEILDVGQDFAGPLNYGSSFSSYLHSIRFLIRSQAPH